MGKKNRKTKNKIVVEELLKLDEDMVNLLSGSKQDRVEVEDLVLRSVEREDVTSLENLFEKGLHLNKPDNNNESLLHVACKYGHVSIVDKLLENGFDINLANKDGDTPLYRACYNGHSTLAKYLIEKGADVNTVDNRGVRPLHIAVYRGLNDVVNKLLEAGSRVNDCYETGDTALHLASQSGNSYIVDKLIEKGAEVNSQDNRKITALHLASNHGHKEVVDSLIRAGADVNLPCEDMVLPLHLVCRNGNEEILDSLLKAGANVNEVDDQGNIPLCIAYLHNYENILEKLLLVPEVNVNASNADKSTLLHKACGRGDIKLVDKLISCYDINVNVLDKNGFNPLDIAYNRGYMDIVDKLYKLTDLTGQPKKKLQGIKRNIAMHRLPEVCRLGNMEELSRLLNMIKYIDPEFLADLMSKSPSNVIEYLIKQFDNAKIVQALSYIEANDVRGIVLGQIFDKRDILREAKGDTRTVLYTIISRKLIQACRDSDQDTVKKMLDTGIDVKKDVSYLNAAIASGSDIIVKLLREKGAKEEKNTRVSVIKNIVRTKKTKQDNKNEILLLAINKGKVPDVRKLLNNGVSADISDKNGVSALMHAIKKGDEDIINALLEKDANVNAVDKQQKSILMYAIEEGNVELVKKLVQREASVSSKNKEGKSVLMYALEKGESMSDIIDSNINSANIDDIDNNGMDLLMYACRGGYMDAIKVLVERGMKVGRCCDEQTALGIAFNKGNLDVVEYFIKKGVTETGRIYDKNEFFVQVGRVTKGLPIRDKKVLSSKDELCKNESEKKKGRSTIEGNTVLV